MHTRCMTSRVASVQTEVLTPREASELTKLGAPRTFQRWAKDGKLPHIVLPNGRVMFYRKDIEALMERKAADGGVGVEPSSIGEPVGGDRVPDSGGAGAATLPGLGKAGR